MEVVIKAGYEVEGSTKREAVKSAIDEMLNEIAFKGLGDFAIDVDGEPFEESVAKVLSDTADEDVL